MLHRLEAADHRLHARAHLVVALRERGALGGERFLALTQGPVFLFKGIHREEEFFDTAFETVRAGQIIGHMGGGNIDVGDINMPNVDLPNVGMPDLDLQGMAEGLGGGLEAASSGLGGLLDIAGGIFDSIDFDF